MGKVGAVGYQLRLRQEFDEYALELLRNLGHGGCLNSGGTLSYHQALCYSEKSSTMNGQSVSIRLAKRVL